MHSVSALGVRADAPAVAGARPLEEIRRTDCASQDEPAMSDAVLVPVSPWARAAELELVLASAQVAESEWVWVWARVEQHRRHFREALCPLLAAE